MIEYSKQESEIFNIPFGRLNIDENFIDWESLSEEISASNYKFIRVKISNPKSNFIQQTYTLCKQIHLLEILRVYQFNASNKNQITFNFDNYLYNLVNKDNIEDLLFIIENTYEDIPFGNYTSPYITNIFPINKQRQNFVDFYKNEILKTNTNKIAHIIYNDKQESIGCIISEVFEEYSYTYYVGVLKEHRNKHVLTKTINFIQHTVLENNLSRGLGAARLSNIHSQKAFETNNMDLLSYDFIYLLEI